MAGRVFHAGGPGAGQSAKIANNMMMAINLAGLCEGAVLADRLGLDAKTFFDIAAVSSGDSWALADLVPDARSGRHCRREPRFRAVDFTTDLALKDVRLAVAAGAATGTDLDFADNGRQEARRAVDLGYGSKDCTSLVRLVDGRSRRASGSDSLDRQNRIPHAGRHAGPGRQ